MALKSTATPITPNFYRVPDLAKKATASVATIWRWAGKGYAPPIVKIGPGVSGGRREDWDSFFADPPGWRAKSAASSASHSDIGEITADLE